MEKEIYFIGIAGPSGSGKSTVSKELEARSKNFERIHLDNYFKSPKTFPKKGKFTNWERPENLKFDLLLLHLKKLSGGQEVHTETFAKAKGSKGYKIVLKPKKYILVEGFILFLNKQVRDLMDLKFYFDIPTKLMAKRRAQRFGVGVDDEYAANVAIPEFLKYGIKQKKFADHIINTTKETDVILEEVKDIIKEKLK